MAIIINKTIDNFIIAVWNITETLVELEKLTIGINYDKIRYGKFLSDKRKKQWLATRILVSKILQNEAIRINYDKNGKPIISDNSCNITISHSKDMVAVAFDKNKKIGIDIQFITERIHNIGEKFLVNDELKLTGDNTICKIIYWCAKETIFKMQDNLSVEFKHIFVEPFDIEDEGYFYANIQKYFYRFRYKINYQKISNYILTWAVE